MRLTRLIASTRLVFLLFLLPPAILWSQSTGAGGAWPAIALCLLALAHLAIFDTKTLAAGSRARLGFTRHPLAHDRAIASLWAMYTTVALAIVLVLMLVFETRLALFFLVASLIVLPLTGGVGAGAGTRHVRARRLLTCEVTHPFAALLLPAFIVASGAHTIVVDDEVVTIPVTLSPLAWGVTWLSALTLSAYLLACMIRDRGLDRTDGQVTTPTLLGRHGAVALAFLVLVTLQIVAIAIMVPAGLSPATPAVAAVGGMATLWCLAQEGDDSAPILILLTQALLVASLAL